MIFFLGPEVRGFGKFGEANHWNIHSGKLTPRWLENGGPGLSRCMDPIENDLLGQWLNFKLFGITYLVGKIKFKLFFSGSIG